MFDVGASYAEWGILLSIDKDGYFILLSDERSPVFNYQKGGKVRGLIPLLNEFVPDKYKDRIVLATIQEIVHSIESNGRHNDWINEFELKYGLKKAQMTNTRYKTLGFKWLFMLSATHKVLCYWTGN